MDLVHLRALEQTWERHMSELSGETLAWLREIGFDPRSEDLWLAALTHGSHEGEVDYERLEFLGDRVLGLCMADWLYRNNSAAEGKLSQRLNALVSRETCARIANRIELAPHIRMGKQARGDGGRQSVNILGDVMESLLGASFIDCGFETTSKVIQQLWADELAGGTGQSKHPKSALQEWAAGNQRRPPEYELISREGPDHAAKFTVRVSVKNVGEAQATASNKQRAEKLAAQAFMEQFG